MFSTRDQFIQEQQETMANYEAEVESLKEKVTLDFFNL